MAPVLKSEFGDWSRCARQHDVGAIQLHNRAICLIRSPNIQMVYAVQDRLGRLDRLDPRVSEEMLAMLAHREETVQRAEVACLVKMVEMVETACTVPKAHKDETVWRVGMECQDEMVEMVEMAEMACKGLRVHKESKVLED